MLEWALLKAVHYGAGLYRVRHERNNKDSAGVELEKLRIDALKVKM